MTMPDRVDLAAHHGWIEPLARAGLATRGLVYLIIGGFAVFAAFGPSRAEGTEGAFATFLSQPFGQILLVVVGFVGFAVWRVVQAYIDTDGHGAGAKKLAIRTGMVGSGLVHVGLALLAAGMALDGTVAVVAAMVAAAIRRAAGLPRSTRPASDGF
jgi:hypothetical protein